MRVHVIGAPGSGKTYLATRLRAVSGHEVHALDDVARAVASRPGVDVVAARSAAAEAIAGEPSWISEGIYLGWVDPLLERADLVIWLDLPRRTTARAIVTRHAAASLRGTNRHKGLRLLARFLRYHGAYYRSAAPPPVDGADDGAITRRHVGDALAPFGPKVVRCRSRRDVRRLLARLEPTGG